MHNEVYDKCGTFKVYVAIKLKKVIKINKIIVHNYQRCVPGDSERMGMMQGLQGKEGILSAASGYSELGEQSKGSKEALQP